MHGTRAGIESVVMLVMVAAVVWALLWFGSLVIRAIRSLFSKPEIPVTDEWQQAWNIVSQPRAMPGGKWMRLKHEWEECDPPPQTNTLLVHDRGDPNHVKNCPECKGGSKPTYSGVSYRSN